MSAHNVARLLARAALPELSRSRGPYKLNWILTERCNLRCAFCHVWQSPRPELTLEEIRQFLERSNGFSWVDLSGGEIFLREDLGEILAAVVSRCRRLAVLHFPTNGYLTERILSVTRELLAMRRVPLVVTVSVDGPPQIHDALRGVAGSFERAVDTYARLRELRGCRVYLGMTLGSRNLGVLGETLAAVRRVVPGVDWRDLHLNLAQRSGHYYKNPGLARPAPAGVAADVRQALAGRGFPRGPFDVVERRYLALVGRHLGAGGSPVRCRALSATCFVAADGTVYPCLSWERPLGALRACGHDLAAIWSSPAAGEAREMIRRGACPGCWTPCEAYPALAGSPRRLLF